MPKFVVEKLPAHWLFVPSKRQVRELLAEPGADVRLVEFYGTGYGRNPHRLSLGLVESRVVGGSWCFYLHLWGVREAVAGPVREELADAVLAEIGRYIRGCAGQLPADTVKPAQLYMVFRVEAGEVRPECRVSPVGKLRRSRYDRWWAIGAEAEPSAAAVPARDIGSPDSSLTGAGRAAELCRSATIHSRR